MSLSTINIASHSVTDLVNKVNEIITVSLANTAIWTSANDGPGSGLNADLLDGMNSVDFVSNTYFTGTNILSRLLTVDGPSSGLNADLLDGMNSADFVSNTYFTGANILSRLLTVDGPGSGLNADTLDGMNSVDFVSNTYFSAANILSRLITVDGPSSGLDADLLDGYDSSAFAFMNGDVAFNTVLVRTNIKAGSYYTSSDERLKQDIATVTETHFDKLNSINVVNYRFKNDLDKIRTGVIAQELQQIFPEYVHEDEDKYLTVDYNSVIMCMLAKIQDQEKRLKKLEGENN